MPQERMATPVKLEGQPIFNKWLLPLVADRVRAPSVGPSLNAVASRVDLAAALVAMPVLLAALVSLVKAKTVGQVVADQRHLHTVAVVVAAQGPLVAMAVLLLVEPVVLEQPI